MNNKELPSCCQPRSQKNQGFGRGLLAGLIPHSFCILFIVFTLVGSIAGASFARKFLLIPNFFPFLIAISLIFATISAYLYLRRRQALSNDGLKNNWRYLSILYGTTLAVNFVFIYLIFPTFVAANNRAAAPAALASVSVLNIDVAIPCSGHAPLIISELKGQPGIVNVSYQPLSSFEVSYNPASTTAEQILADPIFKEYPATKK